MTSMKFKWFFLGFGTLGLSNALCFPESIPESNRQFIQDADGLPAPIQLGSFWWEAAVSVSALTDLLVSEVLGYHTAPIAPLPWAGWTLMLAGCASAECTETVDPVHVVLDAPAAPPGLLESLRSSHPSRAVEFMGGMYVFTMGMYLKESTKRTAFEEAALPLEYYRIYNSSVNQPQRFFHGLADLDKEDLAMCNDTTAANDFTNVAAFANYLKWTGDTDGVTETPEGFVAKCYDDYFWLAPACRNNPSQCIPLLISDNSIPWPLQWVSGNNLPFALMRQKAGVTHRQILQKFDIMYIAYDPDPAGFYGGLEKSLLVLPPHNATEYKEGNYRTSAQGDEVKKFGSILLERFAPEVKGLVEGIVTSEDDMVKLMKAIPDVISKGFFEHQEEAREKICEWAKSNRDVWEPWMPIRTNCISGFGLVNAQDEPVDSREEAVRCKACPPGRASQFYADATGSTHRCVLCPAGQHQSQVGKAECEPCDPGSFAATSGQDLCSPCAPGSYASIGGMSSCSMCNNTDQTTTALIGDNWIEVRGATSESFCRCVPGRFLDDGTCLPCGVGTSCPGSDELTVLPGFHSTVDNPGQIFQCFADVDRCPGGPPGTCASGRDSTSPGCSECLPGLQPHGAECISCSGGDYIRLVMYALLVMICTGTLHALFYLGHGTNRLQNWLMNAALCVSQLIIFAQVLAVMRRIQAVQWADPFLSLMEYLNVISLETLLSSVRSISCFTSFTPETEFLTRVLFIPLFFALGPCISHIFCAVVTQTPVRKASMLLGTLGSLCLLFFIMMCFVCVEPFRCNVHPGGFGTMQTAPSIFCNFTDEHLRLSIAGGVILMFPLCFLALCSWIIFHQLPERVAKGDTQFVRMTSFLTMRFKPGYEVFAVIFLLRNVLIAVTPMLSSSAASILVMGTLLIVSAALVSYYKPWRSLLSTIVDLSSLIVLLLTLLLATFNVQDQDPGSVMILCTIAVCLLLVVVVVAAAYCAAQYLKAKFGKPFRFFLCHHKATTAAFARWLKMELQGCGAKSFIDLDSLTDLTTLFSYVSSQVETLVVLGSPAIVTRKWCVGEMVTARLSNVDTVLVSLPNFRPPKENFIKEISTMPDVVHLTAYGYGLSEVKATLRWLSKVRTIEIETVSAASMGQLVGELTTGKGIQIRNSMLQGSNGCILADHRNSEALSSAYVLARFLRHTMVDKGMLVTVLGAETPETQLQQMQPSVMILLCSQNCFKSGSMVQCVLTARFLRDCSVLPVISDENFVVPSQAGDAIGIEDPDDAEAYRSVVAAVFLEVALPFMPSTSSEEDLAIRASHIARRLSPGKLKTLRSKLWMTSSSPVHDDNASCGESEHSTGESILAILGSQSAERLLFERKDDVLSAEVEEGKEVEEVEEAEEVTEVRERKEVEEVEEEMMVNEF